MSRAALTRTEIYCLKPVKKSPSGFARPPPVTKAIQSCAACHPTNAWRVEAGLSALRRPCESAVVWRTSSTRSRQGDDELHFPAAPFSSILGILHSVSSGRRLSLVGEERRWFSNRTIFTAVRRSRNFTRAPADRREKRTVDETLPGPTMPWATSRHRPDGRMESIPVILLRRARSAFIGQIDFVHHFRDQRQMESGCGQWATLCRDARRLRRCRSLLASSRKILKLFNPS